MSRNKCAAMVAAGLAAFAAAGLAGAQLALYEHDNFAGRVYRTSTTEANLQNVGFNDKASSVIVRNGRWQLCSDAEFRGQCVTLAPGEYGNLRAMGLNDKMSSVREVGSGQDGWGTGGGSGARITLYEGDDYNGRSFPASSNVADLANFGFNDRASSVRIRDGRWQLCVDADYSGNCVTLGPGSYRSLGAMGVANRVSSVRDLGAMPGGGMAAQLPGDFKIEGRESAHCRLNNVAIGRDFFNGRCTIKQTVEGDRTRFVIRMGPGEPMVFVKRGGNWEYVNKAGGNQPARFRDQGNSALFRWENYRLEVVEDL